MSVLNADSRIVWTADPRHEQRLEADGAPEDVEVDQEDGAALYVHAPAHPSLGGGAGRGSLHLSRPLPLHRVQPGVGPLLSSPDHSSDRVEAVADESQTVGELGGDREKSVGHVGTQNILP